MTLCPIAIAAGCRKCPAFSICPLKTVLGDQKPNEAPGKAADPSAKADLLIGAVLLPGLHAPRIVSEAIVKTMQPGSVIIDISVDQGGCVETIHATDYASPTYVKHGVVHFGVTNMPGAVPRTSSQALSAVITPYVQRLATPGWALEKDLQNGINIRDGKIDNPLIEQALA